eukprot:679487-Amorphochlora_amoeboformis.AAC.1
MAGRDSQGFSSVMLAAQNRSQTTKQLLLESKATLRSSERWEALSTCPWILCSEPLKRRLKRKLKRKPQKQQKTN